MKTAQLHKFFYPKSIAIIGASRSKKKVGGIILNNLLTERYSGRLYAINPNATQVQKQKSYDTVAEIPEIVDIAIITIPSQFVEESILECGQKGIKNIIVVSSGYSESGEQGIEREFRLRKLIDKYQLNLLGPNCLGVINARNNLNLSFAHNPRKFSRGKISVISQSGAIGTAFLDWSVTNNIEISKFVSLGNKAGLNELDFLEYLEQDKETEIILAYLENFADGRRFYELAKLITRHKPLVILKSGKSEASERAMSAHTGALATNDRVVDQALRDSGCIRVDSIEELFNITKLLSWQPVLKGNRVTVITNAGGVAIDAVDQLAENSLEVVPLPLSLQTQLSKTLKPSASTHNPIDLLGDALARDYKVVLEKIVKSSATDCILIILTPQLMTESLQTAKYINHIADKYKKVVLASFIGGEKVSVARAFLTKEKLPHFSFPNNAANVLGKIWKWRKFIENTHSSRLHYPTIINPQLTTSNKGEMLDEKTAKKLFDKYGVNYLKSSIFQSVRDIRLRGDNLKFPVVLKLVSPYLVHKTEIKAVRLPIYRKSELFHEAMELENIALKKDIKEFKFEIQPFVFQKLELILGINKDPDQTRVFSGDKVFSNKGFGHVMLVGAGGIYTEVLDDSVLKLLPINRTDALEMLKSIKTGKILFGARRQQYHYPALLKMMVNLSRLIEKNSNIKSLDINPVFVTENDAYAVDVKIFLED